MSFLRLFGFMTVFLTGLLVTMGASMAQAEPIRVLWWLGSPNMEPDFNAGHRQAMVRYLNSYEQGSLFEVNFRQSTKRGSLAGALNSRPYDVVVLDVVDRTRNLNSLDVDALRSFYANGRQELMLDGSLGIRSMKHNPTTQFPGVEGATGALLVNQVLVLGQRGGGILIGSDHEEWQVNSNYALKGLLPDAQFSGLTNPSTDGDFFGNVLLGLHAKAKPINILRHWESIPNQGEAPVGTYTSFLGFPVTLYPLVEAADKPGGGRRRAYISATFDPGSERTRIDSEAPLEEEPPEEFLPAHKSPTGN